MNVVRTVTVVRTERGEDDEHGGGGGGGGWVGRGGGYWIIHTD